MNVPLPGQSGLETTMGETITNGVETQTETVIVTEPGETNGKEAKAILNKLEKAYKRGSDDFRKANLEAGKLAHEYVILRISEGETRNVAIKIIEGRLLEVCCESIDANKLIAAYHANLLLGDEKVKAPLGNILNCWTQLVQRTRKDTAEESWEVLPGFEDMAMEAYKTATDNRLSRESCSGKVKAIMALYTSAQKAKADKEAADAKAIQLEADKLAADQEDAEKLAADTLAAAQKGMSTASVEQAKQELLDAQRETIRVNEEKALADSKAEKTERERKDSDRAFESARIKLESDNRKREEKADKTDKKAKKPTVPADEQRVSLANLIDCGKNATVKDLAEIIVKTIMAHSDPLAVMDMIDEQLGNNKDFQHLTVKRDMAKKVA